MGGRTGEREPAPVLTYRALFAQPEFRALWTSTALSTVAATMSSLALATLVHRETGSALLTAVAMFGPSVAQVLGPRLSCRRPMPARRAARSPSSGR